jgi:hypothetical protein
MPAKKRTPKAEVKSIPIVPQELYVDQLIRDLVATVKAVAPGRDFSSVIKAEKYLMEKAK